jgi:hypothetical protein
MNRRSYSPKVHLRKLNKMIQKKIFISLMVVLYSFSCFAQGIDMKAWKVLSEENKPAQLTDTVFLDKPCVKLDGKIKSAIWNKASEYQNFRVDMDVAGAVMSGLGFHVSDEQNYQFIYFRPGYGGTVEAIQYIPIYNGALSWVMYGKYQATADIKRLEWFHAAIEVRGNNLKVFTNSNKKPDMDITILPTKAAKGSILLRTMFGASYFANVNVKELPEAITDWEISDQMAPSMEFDYSQVKQVKNWRKINELADEYVNLCRYFEYPDGTLFARHSIHSQTSESRPLLFDFAGKLHILLNGK